MNNGQIDQINKVIALLHSDNDPTTLAGRIDQAAFIVQGVKDDGESIPLLCDYLSAKELWFLLNKDLSASQDNSPKALVGVVL